MLLMAQNPATNPMKEEFEDEEYSVDNEPQKQVFEQNQDKEYALNDDSKDGDEEQRKHSSIRSKSKSGRSKQQYRAEQEEGDDHYSAEGYSFEEGTSSVAKSKKEDPRHLTDRNFAKKKKSDDGYSSVKNTSHDGYSSLPKSSKSAAGVGSAQQRQVAKKAEPSESQAYTQENYDDDDYSQGASSKPVSKPGKALQSEHKPDRNEAMISGGKNLANPPSMAQLQQENRDSRPGSKLAAKTDGTHPQQLRQDTIEESERIVVADDSATGSNTKGEQPKFTYHKLDNDHGGSPAPQTDEIGEDIDNPSYSGFDQASKEKDEKVSDGKSNEEFFLDEDNISVDHN